MHHLQLSAQNAALMAKFFVRVLELAHELKPLVGTISVDGSQFKANASSIAE